MRIQKLSPLVISRINAGEVIDRPAAVVKELIENALDSGATRIQIQIEDGGKQKIKVTDNGSGIHPEDLSLAPVPHATSKLKEWEDIYTVHSFGFRGEALASMAQAGDLTLISRTDSTPVAYQVHAFRDHISTPEAVSHPVGTTVILSDLFKGMPVRQKFLKSATSESSAIYDVILHHALIAPHIDFVYLQDGKEKLNTTSIKSSIDLAVCFFGKSVKSHLIPVDITRQGVSIKGLLADPGLTYPNRAKQWVAIQGRPVKFSIFHKAIHGLYAPRMPAGRFGLAILDIHIPRSEIDINTHPQKAEFQISQSAWAYTQVQAMLASVFANAREHALVGWQSAPTSHVPATFPESAPPGSTLPWNPSPPFSFSQSMPLFDPLVLPNQPAVSPTSAQRIRYFQVFDTYLIVQTDSGVVLLDQHAVHERIMYERFSKAAKGPGMGQPLVVPEMIQLPPDLFPIFEHIQPELQALGFEVLPFGGTSVQIREIPIEWMGVPLTPFLIDWIEQVRASLTEKPDIENKDTQADILRAKHDRLAQMACKSAIKAGKPLSDLETETLIRDFLSSPNRDTCPHGRPVAILLDQSKLERLFLRS
jgi:DNA mismatch repair protein MutL